MKRVWQSVTGPASSSIRRAARTQLPGEAVVPGVGEVAAAVGGAEGHEGVHVGVAAEAGHVVARDQPAHRVADDVDALVAGLLDDALDLGAQPGGGRPDVVGEDRVVDRLDLAEAAAHETAAQHGEDRAVVDHAVHEQDRGLGRLDVVDGEAALARGQVLEAVAPAAVAWRGARAARAGRARGAGPSTSPRGRLRPGRSGSAGRRRRRRRRHAGHAGRRAPRPRRRLRAASLPLVLPLPPADRTPHGGRMRHYCAPRLTAAD